MWMWWSSSQRRPRPLPKQKRWSLRIFECCIRTIIFFQGTQSWLKLQLSRSFNPIYCAQLLVPILNKTIVGQISSFSPLLPKQQLFSFQLIIFAFAFDYLFTLVYSRYPDYLWIPDYCINIVFLRKIFPINLYRWNVWSVMKIGLPMTVHGLPRTCLCIIQK